MPEVEGLQRRYAKLVQTRPLGHVATFTS
jgi:hypothetical protein